MNPFFPPIVLGHYAISLSTQQLVAVALIVVLTLTNTRGLRLGALIQNSFTFAKTAALIGLIAIGLTLGVRGNAAAWTSSWWNSAANGWTSTGAYDGRLPVEGAPALVFLLGLAMIGPLFSQSAWNNVTFTGGETRDPGRSLPRALFLGTTSVVALYLLANLAYLVSLPFAEIQHAPQDRVGTAAMEAALGPAARYVMAAAILISTFGCVNGLVLAGARVYYAMARDGLFFKSVGTTNTHHVPAAALAAQGLWSALAGPAGDRHDRSGHPGRQVWKPLQRPPRVHHPGRCDFLHPDGRRRDRLADQGPVPEPAIPDHRLPDPGVDLHRTGDLSRARFHLPQAQDLGNRLPDRAGGYPGLPDLATDQRQDKAASRAEGPNPRRDQR